MDRLIHEEIAEANGCHPEPPEARRREAVKMPKDGEGTQDAQLALEPRASAGAARVEFLRRPSPPRASRRAASAALDDNSGFTVAELITVVAIVGILASVALPLANFGLRRQKEIELHDRLRKITEAIDRYHEIRMQPPGNASGMKDPGDISQKGWPKSLEELTKPIELNSGQKLRLLRERDLIDPMTGKSDWNILSVDDDPDAQGSGTPNNVYEIHSKSTAPALDGKTHYNQW